MHPSKLSFDFNHTAFLKNKFFHTLKLGYFHEKSATKENLVNCGIMFIIKIVANLGS